MAAAGKLREKGIVTPIIFVTSLENRAIDGYDVGAYGFIVKKSLDEKLPRILNKLWQEHFCRKTLAVNGISPSLFTLTQYFRFSPMAEQAL